MYICMCNGITDGQIRQCASEGACSLSDLQAQLGVGAGCGKCMDCAIEILSRERRTSGDAAHLSAR